MRIDTDATTPGRLQLLVEYHPALAVDPAAVAAAVHEVLARTLALLPPDPCDQAVSRNEVVSDEEPPAGPRSSEDVRQQALRLLDEQGYSDAEVCTRLGISRAQLLRWDDDQVAEVEPAHTGPTAHAEPTEHAEPTGHAGQARVDRFGPVLAAAGGGRR